MTVVRFDVEHVRAVKAATITLQAAVDVIERAAEHSPALHAHLENLEELHDRMIAELREGDGSFSVSASALERRLRSVGA